MERKLASIQKITSLSPIIGADMIEKATILGWELVVAKKDNFKVNDLVVYCEIDSILPDKPEFEFLRERKFRIKTIKLKGQISQGICFPVSILPRSKGYYDEGKDVTDELGVKKYDPQAEYERSEQLRLAAIDKNRMDKFLKRYSWYRKLIFKPTKTPFPAFIKKTDEDRIQLFPDYFSKWGHLNFIVTEKIDGQSGTFFVVRNSKKGLFQPKWLFGVCSRNYQLLKSDNSSYWSIAKGLKDKMMRYCKENQRELIIQGEIISDKIQGGKYKRGGYEMFVFNVIIYNKGQNEVLNYDCQNFICDELNLQQVPLLLDNFVLHSEMNQMVLYSIGTSKIAPILREGIVVRNYANQISFKVVSPEFLLKYSE
jgi:hypothetical protein